ncbi:unnamed protein product [Amoebophrya sp. A25]|nr:unnamed protein product [Amoebophrya sp. A25]|eukprot:GSA25T00021267001.1
MVLDTSTMAQRYLVPRDLLQSLASSDRPVVPAGTTQTERPPEIDCWDAFD